MVKSKKFVMVRKFEDIVGEPKSTDVKIVEETLRPIENGEYLTESLYLSVDPYMRLSFGKGIGDVIDSFAVARVIESKNKDFPVGSLVSGHLGWRTHTLITKEFENHVPPPYVLPDLGTLPLSTAVGVLGMPGNTAYFGIRDYLRPKAGETIIISGAAGAVGSHVGQILKSEGCTVIGLAGSDAKCDWLVKELGFDYAFNYKTVKLQEELPKCAPNGIDMYFDNVGNDTIATILNHMNMKGRIALCGVISTISDLSKIDKVEPYLSKFLMKAINLAGFHVYHYGAEWNEGIKANLKHVKEGKLKYPEHVTIGFENMFEALLGVLRGENFGKAVVKVK